MSIWEVPQILCLCEPEKVWQSPCLYSLLMRWKWFEGLGECGERGGKKKTTHSIPPIPILWAVDETARNLPGWIWTRSEYKQRACTFFFFWTDEWTMVIEWLFEVRFCSLHHLTLKCARFRFALPVVTCTEEQWSGGGGGGKMPAEFKGCVSHQRPRQGVCACACSAYLRGLIIYTWK